MNTTKLLLGLLLLNVAMAYNFEFNRGNNPLNIRFDQKRSNNYFLVIGDWGQHPGGNPDCQYSIAYWMRDYVAKQKAQGKTLLFIAAAGDNFYWSGVPTCNAQDKHWKSQWSNVYGSLAEDYYWFPVYGNHDMGSSDKYAMCPHKDRSHPTNSGNQKSHCAPEKWYMPDNSYYYRFDEISLEFIAIDTNAVDCPNGIGGRGSNSNFNQCGGKNAACGFLKDVMNSGKQLLNERRDQSKADSIFTIQHYHDQCQRFIFPNLEGNRQRDVKCAHGHVHQMKCVWGRDPDCKVLMSGAGGGCCGESNPYGFSAVHLDDNGRMKTTTNVHPIYKGQCGMSKMLEESSSVQDLLFK